MKYIEKIVRKAKEDCSISQYLLAEYYYNGKYVEKDENEALYWYYESSKNGNKDANKKIGLIFYLGKIIQKDIKKAEEYLDKSNISNELYDILFSKEYLEKSKVKTAKELLENELENDALKYNGNNELIEKTTTGNIEEVIKLIKNGADINIIKQPKSPNGIIVSRHILPFILNFLLL